MRASSTTRELGEPGKQRAEEHRTEPKGILGEPLLELLDSLVGLDQTQNLL